MTHPRQPPTGPDEIDVRARLAAGRQRFMNVELLCGPGALVPRPETELLARTALEKLASRTAPLRVIDLCCGVGNLAGVIATNLPHAHVWASDLTDACIRWTRDNVTHLGLTDRITVTQGDLFQGLDGLGLEGAVDAVVCNPPYVSTGRLETGRAVLLEHEPREAFDGGPYGLTIHQRVVADAPRFLSPGGWLLMEFGVGQHRQLQRLLDRGGRFSSVEFVNNAEGAPRVVAARV